MALGTSFTRRLAWRSNKRLRGRQDRVPDDIVNQANALRESGEFDASVELLQGQPSLGNDVAALNMLALGRLALGDFADALQALDNADEELRRQQWGIEVNRANILKCAGDFERATVAAARAIELRPDATSGYLISIAVSECAGSDRAFVKKLVEQMDKAVPDWRRDRGVLEDLLTDSDYIALRQDKESFTALFGFRPSPR